MCGQECDAPVLAVTLSVRRGGTQGHACTLTAITVHRGPSSPLKKPRQEWAMREEVQREPVENTHSPASSEQRKAPQMFSLTFHWSA